MELTHLLIHIYCGDCGHKLWFNFNQKNPSIRFFSCSNYKGMRGTCENTHYIREDALEQIVLMELTGLLLFLLPVTINFVDLTYTLPVVCTVATVAAIHEVYDTYSEKKHDT